MMPNMNGYEFVQTLRDNGDTTPVIMLTAMDSFDHKKKGFALGKNAILCTCQSIWYNKTALWLF